MGLGCVAGYVDTLGFMALFGLFTAHVTGNFVLIGIGLADPPQASILLKFLAVPAFISGVAFARLLTIISRRHRAPELTLALLLQLLLLCGFMACGLAAAPIHAVVTPFAMAAGLLGAAAMGAHGATNRLLLAHLAPTSMMTGNVTQIVIDVVDQLSGADDDALGAHYAKFVWPLLAFGVGAVLAGFAYQAFGFTALLLPIAILCCLIALQWRADQQALAAS
jgi:uncharacterized membrane protein YoaK (UPF0700 family)